MAAFAVVYVIWGSTYLAIRWSVAEIPPFLMAGGRFLSAGYRLPRVGGIPGCGAAHCLPLG